MLIEAIFYNKKAGVFGCESFIFSMYNFQPGVCIISHTFYTLANHTEFYY
jgi:hypothetical protein